MATDNQQATLAIVLKIIDTEAKKQFSNFAVKLGTKLKSELGKAIREAKVTDRTAKRIANPIATHIKDSIEQGVKTAAEKAANKGFRVGQPETPDFGLEGVANTQSQILKLAKSINRIEDAGLDASTEMEQLRKSLQLLNKVPDNKLDKEIRKLRRSVKDMNFDFLTFLFAGMMMKDIFGGAIKTIIDGYNTLTGKQTLLGKATTKVSANFNYLKFAIGNALNNPLVIGFIEKIADGLNWLADWVSEHPGIVITLTAIAGALALIGGISMGVSLIQQMGMLGDGFIKLGGAIKDFSISSWNSIIDGFKYLKGVTWADITTGIGNLTTKLKAFFNIKYVGLLTGIALIIGALYSLYQTNNKHLNDLNLEVDGTWNNIKSITVTFLAGLGNLFVQALAGIINLFVAVGGAIKTIFVGIWESIKGLGKGIWNSIKAGIKGEDITDAFLEGFNFDNIKTKALNTWQDAVSAMNDVSATANNISSNINTWEYDKQIAWANAIKLGDDNISQLSPNLNDLMSIVDSSNIKLDNMSSNLGDVNFTANELTKSLKNNSSIFIDYSSEVEKLKTSIDNLNESLDKLNNKSVTYTIRENRVSSTGSAFAKIISPARS